jgi:hypothetical protein
MFELRDFMQYKNVLSKSCLIPKDKMGLAAKDFLETVGAMGVTMHSLPFFSLENIQGGAIKLRYHISVEDNNPTLPKGMRFDSYFGIDEMASVCVTGDYETRTQGIYENLLRFIDENGMLGITPLFVVVRGDETTQCAVLKVGYADKRFFSEEANMDRQQTIR